MAARSKSMKQNDVMKGAFGNRGKNSKKRSPPAFVPLDGPSQSTRDRAMNNRPIKPPKNLNLVEGDPDDTVEFQTKSRQIQTFPNEHLLSSQIKEVNGMDYSNHFIEQYYRCQSRSTSPEIDEESTNSSSITNGSMPGSCRGETCISSISSIMGTDNSNIESDLQSDVMEDAIRNSRFHKNAAIIGLLKNNMISINDLELSTEYPLDNENGETVEDNRVDVSIGEINSEARNVAEYSDLVPFPEDPDVLAHPFQVYGKVDDAGIDYGPPRIGKKTIMTPRQYYISAGLDDDKFTFKRQTTAAPKPVIDVNFPKTSPTRLECNQNYSNAGPSSSYIENEDSEEFRLNRDEFPTL